MRYLITGGAGFIGSHLVDALVSRGDEVLVLDDMSTGRAENLSHLTDSDRFKLVEGSVLDAYVVDSLMRDCDCCFHLASAVGVKLIISQPLNSLLANVRGNDVVTSAAASHGRRLLLSSSSEIYGKSNGEALTETSASVLGSPHKSRWAYATAKAVGEHLAYGYHRERGLPVVVARIFNTVGPRQAGAYGMVLPRLVKQALAAEDLSVYGDGMQSRCFTHVLDTVHALVLLMDCEEATGEVFNVGSSGEVAIDELARRVIERTRSSSAVRFVPYANAYGDGFEELGRRTPDTTALSEATGWSATRTIDEAIDDVIAYQRGAGKHQGSLGLAR
ncbi:MAG: GDP-mannose 4,6-dehydratase [Thermoleophilaceae bacterium]|nr:GDP-mannose 4,6-dehydratase [Thermoleophilaceae bacterium]